MKPVELGQKYNKIAPIFQKEMEDSKYGLPQVKRAITYSNKSGTALDVGCGAGGRIIQELQNSGFAVLGLDVASSMIDLARATHPDIEFEVADICTWEATKLFDFIVAWDSLFHLPLDMQKPVLKKLAALLAPGGVIIYTFGDAVGEHIDTWHDNTFYYSSIGINQNLEVLIDNGLSVNHLEMDQYPEKHVYVIATKP
jgi:SAM-dependent methyltransferase